MIYKAKNILIIDDEKNILDGCSRILLKEGYSTKTAQSGAQAVEILEKEIFDVVLLDLKLPDIEGVKILEKIKKETLKTEVIIITGYASIPSAVEMIKKGAFDYLSKPFTPDDLRAKVKEALESIDLKFGKQEREDEATKKEGATEIIGKSKKMQELLHLIKKVAPTDSTVLIYGETGVGKELVAREIHKLSLRRDKPFLVVDCGALVESLLESELFGHVKGSFTGAIETKHGSLELANGGTFFFDEISNLSLNMQAKLLRVIQEKEIKPIGGTKTIKVDIRLICATNRDLKKMVEDGLFREDLFYRISVVPIFVPPLRERKEDIVPLVNYFLKKFSQKRKKDIKKVSPEALDILQKHSFRGNVRELQNIIERAVIMKIQIQYCQLLCLLTCFLLSQRRKKVVKHCKK